MNFARNAITAVLSLGLLGSPAFADAPGLLRHQGLLIDSAGGPVTGPVDLGFVLYDDPVAGSPLWSETLENVDVSAGRYEVVLGSLTPLTPATLAGGSIWLEIQVDGETLGPRQRLLAVPSALEAADVETVDGLPAEVVSQIYAHHAFDGEAPPNDDPREGLADTDGDGVANFVDADNDDDGLGDAAELAAGSDINLVTPQIASVDPTFVRSDQPTTVSVSGAGFEPGLSAVVGAQSPAPSNLTPTGFDVQVGPAPVGFVDVTATNANGETDTLTNGLEFVPGRPIITSFDPPTACFGPPTTVTIEGHFFDPGITVLFGTETPAPQNQTSTSLEVDVSGPGAATVVVALTNPNLLTGTSSFEFVDNQPIINALVPSEADFEVATTVQVQGANFDPGVTLTFGTETPTPTNVTPTGFEVTVGPQPLGLADVTVANECGDDASTSFDFIDVKRAFLTSTTHDGNLGGLAGADAVCAARAASAGIPGTFLAWLSDGVDDPDSRFSKIGPWRRTDGQIVASDWAELTAGTLAVALQLDENGTTISGLVFTNVDLDGTTFDGNHCAGWTSTSGSADGGNMLFRDPQWTRSSSIDCGDVAHQYCFEQ